MTMKLRDLIRSVRACKTAADERAIITKESAAIRTAFKEEGAHAHTHTHAEYRERNVAKLLYIHMLGYPTHFGQMECIKLIASSKFAEKRIGYLALNLLLDERQEVLTLVTNSLQHDLNASAVSPYVVGLALTALGNIGSAEMARDLAKDVDSLLKSGNPYIRKKAALCSIRMLRKCPELIDTFLPHIVTLLTDKNHNVLLTGVELVSAVMEIEPTYTEKFTRLVPALVKILRRLLTAGYSPEYDFGGVIDPFLQARLLRLLCVLGRGNAAASEAMNNVLAQVASNTETAKSAGNSVLYECVNTIMSVESESGLRVLAVNILGKFLGNKDANLKYVALETLCKVVHLDPLAVQRHRAVIVECLRDTDVSIRKRALELVYALVNPDNVRALTKELLNYLAVAEPDIRPDLCVKIAAVAEKFAVSKRWHIDTLLQMLAIAGNHAKKEVAFQTLFLISHEAAAHAAITHKLFAMVAAAANTAAEAQQPLIQVGVWCVGEYGSLLLTPPPSPSEDAVGPHGDVRTEMDIVKVLDKTLHLYYTAADTKAMILTALLKLTVRFSDAAVLARIRRILAAYEGSGDIELQQRSVEFTHISEPGRMPVLDAHREGLLAPMPLLDESVIRARAGAATGSVSDAHALAGDDERMAVVERGTVSKPVAPVDGLAADLGLLGLDGLMGMPSASPAPGSTAKPAAAGRATIDLDALFSGVTATAGQELVSGSVTPVSAGGVSVGGAPSLDDIFGGKPAAAPSAAPAAAAVISPAPAVAPRKPANDMAALDALFAPAAPSPAPAPAPVAVPATIFAAPAPAPVPSPAHVGISDLFAPAPAPSLPSMAAAVPATSPTGVSLPYVFTAYEGPHVRAVFKCEKPLGPGAGATDITATFTSNNGASVTNFLCQVAVPKFLKLTLQPASGNAVSPASSVTQVIKLENSAQGAKAIAIRLRLEYTINGQAVVEQADIKTFPATL